MNRSTHIFAIVAFTGSVVFGSAPATAQGTDPQSSTFVGPSAGATQGAILFDQIVADAQRQLSEEGLSITPTGDGARLRAIFQDLEAEATPEGLWLESIADDEGENSVRFRILATALGREGHALQPLPGTGQVVTGPDSVVFVRPRLTEEYRVSMEGVRQDFLVAEAPAGEGDLHVTLDVTGARAEAAAYGVKLTLDGSGREIAYHRLHVTDATGRKLEAQMVAEAAGRIQVRVDDTNAVYPVRIDPTFADSDWASLGGIPGADSSVEAIAVDGSGNVFIGGQFLVTGDVVTNHIAKWDGSSWSALGSGFGPNDNVSALVVSGSDLYAAGGFSEYNGAPGNAIARWDGTSWHPLGSGISGNVRALAISGADLYAGGSIYAAGGISASNIAKWDGSSWSALGTGITGGEVRALAISGSDVFAGGFFTDAGGTSVNHIARWDGGSWNAMGSGVTGSGASVRALTMLGSDLIVGGRFSNAGGVSTEGIAKWNGGVWSDVGGGVSANTEVRAFAVSGTDLYAGGTFYTAGGVSVQNFAKWDGTNWTGPSPGISGNVQSLGVSGSDVFVGGGFGAAGTVGATNVARFDGSAWHTMGNGIDGNVEAVAALGTDLYIAGSFDHAGTVSAKNIAKWDGSSWSALTPAVSGPVTDLAVLGTDLIVGGAFSITGLPSSHNFLARWDGTSWTDIGGGVNNTVSALEVVGTDLYVGGYFTDAGGVSASRIAKWDGSVWSAFGSGVDSPGFGDFVGAIAVNGSDVYAGGMFTSAGGGATENIAKWNGTSWSALGSGANSTVHDLAASGSGVYVGGQFSSAGGGAAAYIAFWDGSSWNTVGDGLNSIVDALVLSGGDLFVGGSFTQTGTGDPLSYIGRWDGSGWSPLGSGLNRRVKALTISGTNLCAGGNFTKAGGVAAGHVAVGDLAGSPEIDVEEPAGTSLADGGSSDFGSVEVGGSVFKTYAIRNVGSQDLTITGVSVSGGDAGDFSIYPPGLSTTLTSGSPYGSTTYFTVTFTPGATGARSTTLQIANDDADESPFDLTLTGSGFPNSAPTDITLAPSSIQENNAPLAIVGSLSATDPDNPGAGQSHSFTLVSGSGDADNGSFVIYGSDLLLNESADFEMQTSYAIRVRATDSAAIPLSVEKEFTVTVTDVPGDEPEITVVRHGQTFVDNDSYDQNLNDGGLFFPVKAVNVGSETQTLTVRNDGTATLTGLTFNISGPDAGEFSLDLTGTLTVLIPGAETEFDVTFAPLNVNNNIEGHLEIGSNDGDENPFNLLLRGQSVNLPATNLLVDDSSTNGNGNYGPGDLNLGEALQLADAAPDANTITFASTLNGVPLQSQHGFQVGTDVTIVGNGAPATIIDGGGSNGSVLSFQDNGGVPPTISLSGVTVQGGNNSFGSGGGIYNNANLTITDSLITNNSANSEAGGIANYRDLTLIGTTISGNTAGTSGGGIYSGNNGTLTVTNSTISGNSATNAGGLYLETTGILLNTTIASNSATASGAGGITVENDTLTLDNTIVAGNTLTGAPSDIGISSYPYGSIAAGSSYNLIGDPATAGGLVHGAYPGFNIVGDGAGGLLALGSIVDPLGSNGGPTPTHAPAGGSPAIDAGSNAAASSLTADQRGATPRANGAAVDIGSVESGAVLPPPEIEVEQPVGTGLVDGSASVAFGTVLTGGSSTPVTITIINSGVSDLTGLAVTPTGPDAADFSVNTGGMGTSVPAFGATSFTVTFSPATDGAKTAALEIASNDADENPFDISLSGTGLAPPPVNLLVDDGGDTDDGDYTAGNLTLREAIALANLGSDAQSITFDSALDGTPILLGSALDTISHPVTITGNGATETVIDAQQNARLFNVDDGDGGNEIVVTIVDLTLQGGLTAVGENGGGISNSENLTVQRCAIDSNRALGPGSEGGPFAGGIYSSGTLLVEDSTISNNISDSITGGIFSQGTGTFRNTTISGNTAVSNGGIVFTVPGSMLNCTVAGNTGTSQIFGAPFSGVLSFGAAISLHNTIVAGNNEDGGPSDIALFSGGSFTAALNNLIGDPATAGGLVHGTDGNILGDGAGGLLALSSIVGALADNGGETLTHLPGGGSPAIDAGDNASAAALSADQRGYGPRANGAAVDIGSVETGAAPAGPNNPPTYTSYSLAAIKNTAVSVTDAKLLSKASDLDGDTLSISGVSPASTQGGTVVHGGGSVTYTPPTGVTGADSFTITVSDGNGGSVPGTVNVTISEAPSGQSGNRVSLTIQGGGDVDVVYLGIPGRSYDLQRSTDLNNWVTIATITAAPNGTISHTDPSPGGSVFYRTIRTP